MSNSPKKPKISAKSLRNIKNNKSQSSQKISAIHEKISNSAALNGGFDSLIYKIDKIEQGQCDLSGKVDKIHEAIYDPNDGIFSKLSEYKLENYEKFNEVTQHMSEINEWKKHLNETKNENSKEVDQASEKINELEKSVGDLVKSKKTTWTITKWLAAAIGGGLITLIFKWIEGKL